MKTRTRLTIVILLSGLLVPAAVGGVPVVSLTAGSNLSIDFNQEVDVPYSGFAGQYFFHSVLIHDPNAGPFFKNFQSPFLMSLYLAIRLARTNRPGL